MRYIIIVNGFKRSGKNTFVNILNDISTLDLFEVSWVEDIKRIAKSKHEWDGKKDNKGRRLLADLADKYDKDCFKYVTNKEKTISKVKEFFIYCIHARRPRNIQELVEYYNKPRYKVITVFIDRKKVSKYKQSNSADSEVLDYQYDYFIENNDTSKHWREKYAESILTFYKEVIVGV